MICMTFSLSFVSNICEKLWYEICSQIMNIVRYINIIIIIIIIIIYNYFDTVTSQPRPN